MKLQSDISIRWKANGRRTTRLELETWSTADEAVRRRTFVAERLQTPQNAFLPYTAVNSFFRIEARNLY